MTDLSSSPGLADDEVQAEDLVRGALKESVAMGKAIIELRHRRGLTQRQLATRAGLSENHVGKLERGEVADPGLTSIAKVARALDISVTYFVLAFAGRPRRPTTRASPDEQRRPPSITPATALGAVVRMLRRRTELSQAVLAEAAGLAAPTLSRIECGKKQDLAVGTLVRLAGALAAGDETMSEESVLAQLSSTFAEELDVPVEALRWLRRRRPNL
jgi:transcriptional regulator with XRE-family HTH domain